MNQQPGKAVFSIKFGCILVSTTSVFCSPKEQERKAADFIIKRHDVLKKTIRCFEKNNTMFWRKQHDVLKKQHVVFQEKEKADGNLLIVWFLRCVLQRRYDTCDSKKTQTAVGCARRCVHTYAHTHARGEQIHGALPFFLAWTHADKIASFATSK